MTAPEIPGLKARHALTLAERDEMFELLTRHFEGVTREQFESDLAEKNWVLHVRKDERLLGFSTLLAVEVDWEGALLTAIYSGDTIMSPEGWGSPALSRLWIAAVNYLRGRFPERPCYWLLLTSGFRTYRFLPVFWREFYPRFDAATPAWNRRLLDHLAALRYGACYRDGIVRFPRPQWLRDTLSEVPEGRLKDEHVTFFLQRNPGHESGDELVCLTEIHETNLTAAGRRMVRPA